MILDGPQWYRFITGEPIDEAAYRSEMAQVTVVEGKGGPGSGDHGHAGRPGQVGGSGSLDDGSTGFNAGGKAYVVEDIMKRRGLDGGPMPDGAAAKALAMQAAEFAMGEPTWVNLHYNSADSMRFYGGGPEDLGIHSPMGIAINSDKEPSRLTVLHETAHQVAYLKGEPAGEHHGKLWEEEAAKLYGKFISPEAESAWRDLMDLPEAKGSSTSGNFGHPGRPGLVGGSGPGGVTLAFNPASSLEPEDVASIWSRAGSFSVSGGDVIKMVPGDPGLTAMILRAQAMEAKLRGDKDASPMAGKGAEYVVAALKAAQSKGADALVGTKDGMPVAALSFKRFGDDILREGVLGSTNAVPGAATALELEMAKLAAAEDRTVNGSFTVWSEAYHESIGRKVGEFGTSSKWFGEDVKIIAAGPGLKSTMMTTDAFGPGQWNPDSDENAWLLAEGKGGAGSGNFDHAGRPGLVGGSYVAGSGTEPIMRDPADASRFTPQQLDKMRAEWAKYGLDHDTMLSNFRTMFEQGMKNNGGDPRRAGAFFYEENHDALVGVASAYKMDLATVVGVTAAASPGLDWTHNLRMAKDIVAYSKMDNPTPDGLVAFLKSQGGYGVQSWRDAQLGLKIALEPDRLDELLTGPKRRSFFDNLFDPTISGPATIDRHAMAAMVGHPLTTSKKNFPDNTDEAIARLVSQVPSQAGMKLPPESRINGTYPLLAQIVREAAAGSGLSPHHYQAVAWFAWRKEWPPRQSAMYGRGLVDIHHNKTS